MRVAYIMSRFPRLTETFIVSEILAVQQRGVEVELYPLLRERAVLVQPDARRLDDSARYQPFLSLAILRSNLRLMRRRPRAYARAVVDVVRMTWGSLNFLGGGLAIFPKVAHNGLQMKRSGVSHVHCHFASHPALAGLIIKRLTGIPYSFTAHGSDLHVDRRGLAQKVSEAAFVVAISQFNRDVILEETGGRWAEKVAVIHCGVEIEPRDQPESGGRVERRHALSIVCVGTLHEVKGQRYLVQACRILADAGHEVSCTFVGDGEDRPTLERQIEDLGLGDAVRLVGARTRSEIFDLLAEADVLVAPSVPTSSGKREGIPVVLMEAMSVGVPVVASDLSGIPELVVDGTTGLLVRPRDAAHIAEALGRLAADVELRRRLGAAGRDKVSTEFNIAASAAALAKRFDRSERMGAS